MAKTPETAPRETASSPATTEAASAPSVDHFADGVHRFHALVKEKGSYAAAAAAAEREKGGVEFRSGINAGMTVYHTHSKATPGELVKLARTHVTEAEAKKAAEKAAAERRANR
jgi:hypothetical protein